MQFNTQYKNRPVASDAKRQSEYAKLLREQTRLENAKAEAALKDWKAKTKSSQTSYEALLKYATQEALQFSKETQDFLKTGFVKGAKIVKDELAWRREQKSKSKSERIEDPTQKWETYSTTNVDYFGDLDEDLQSAEWYTEQIDGISFAEKGVSETTGELSEINHVRYDNAQALETGGFDYASRILTQKADTSSALILNNYANAAEMAAGVSNIIQSQLVDDSGWISHPELGQWQINDPNKTRAQRTATILHLFDELKVQAQESLGLSNATAYATFTKPALANLEKFLNEERANHLDNINAQALDGLRLEIDTTVTGTPGSISPEDLGRNLFYRTRVYFKNNNSEALEWLENQKDDIIANAKDPLKTAAILNRVFSVSLNGQPSLADRHPDRFGLESLASTTSTANTKKDQKLTFEHSVNVKEELDEFANNLNPDLSLTERRRLLQGKLKELEKNYPFASKSLIESSLYGIDEINIRNRNQIYQELGQLNRENKSNILTYEQVQHLPQDIVEDWVKINNITLVQELPYDPDDEDLLDSVDKGVRTLLGAQYLDTNVRLSRGTEEARDSIYRLILNAATTEFQAEGNTDDYITVFQRVSDRIFTEIEAGDLPKYRLSSGTGGTADRGFLYFNDNPEDTGLTGLVRLNEARKNYDKKNLTKVAKNLYTQAELETVDLELDKETNDLNSREIELIAQDLKVEPLTLLNALRKEAGKDEIKLDNTIVDQIKNDIVDEEFEQLKELCKNNNRSKEIEERCISKINNGFTDKGLTTISRNLNLSFSPKRSGGEGFSTIGIYPLPRDTVDKLINDPGFTRQLGIKWNTNIPNKRVNEYLNNPEYQTKVYTILMGKAIEMTTGLSPKERFTNIAMLLLNKPEDSAEVRELTKELLHKHSYYGGAQ